jgi:hypothetical protein
MTATTYKVELTLAEVIALRDLIAGVHADQAYYASDRLDEVDEDNSWKRSSILAARERQLAMSKLHFALLGEVLEPTPEKDPKPADADA